MPHKISIKNWLVLITSVQSKFYCAQLNWTSYTIINYQHHISIEDAVKEIMKHLRILHTFITGLKTISEQILWNIDDFLKAFRNQSKLSSENLFRFNNLKLILTHVKTFFLLCRTEREAFTTTRIDQSVCANMLAHSASSLPYKQLKFSESTQFWCRLKFDTWFAESVKKLWTNQINVFSDIY